MIPGENNGTDHLEDGKIYEHEEISHLCRCGHSADKPFCDGAHIKIWFSGEETASKAEYQDGAMFYQWADLDLIDKEEYCAVARFCHAGKGTWQDVADSNDPDVKARAIKSASGCFSGRLTAVDKDGNLIEPIIMSAVGMIEDLGKDCRWPLFVQWGIEIESSDGETYPVRNRQTLCRCGQSWNMPFCDASHLRCEHMQGLDLE